MITKHVIGTVADTKRRLKSDPRRPVACAVCQLHALVIADYEEPWQNERATRPLPNITETIGEMKEKVGLAQIMIASKNYGANHRFTKTTNRDSVVLSPTDLYWRLL